MRNWWQLGEGFGHYGGTLSIHSIECPFCEEKGNFSTDYHKEKKKPSSSKVLNFDVLKCGNCAGFVHVLWSASEHLGSHGLHDYRVLPYPLRTSSAPKHWPPSVQRYWLQSRRSLEGENWDASIVMTRSALEAALKEQGAKGGDLKIKIDDLAGKGLLPPIMREWSHELRSLGNDSAHDDVEDEDALSRQANDIFEFLDYLLEYLYTLPTKIKQYRFPAEESGEDDD